MINCKLVNKITLLLVIASFFNWTFCLSLIANSSIMDSNATESWIYTLGEIELRRLANAFNINAAGVVPILRDRVVRYIKKRAGDNNIPWEEDETLDTSQSQIRDDQTVSRKPSELSNILDATAFNTYVHATPTATTTSTIMTCAGASYAPYSQGYTAAYPGPVASHFANASRFVPVAHQAPSTTISSNLATESPPFVPHRVISFIAQQSFDYMGISTPNIHSNFNPYAPHNNGGANVYNSTRIPSITSDEEQNFNSAPTNSYNHNSRGTNTRVELNRDVSKVVRQWNLKFNGSSKASAENFLTRLNECRIFSPLSDIELISALPLLLTGVALQWYRLKKSQWTSWSTFRTAFRITRISRFR